MIIKQEETSPICDYFDSHHIIRAFKEIDKLSGATNCDTVVLKAFCENTRKLLNDFENFIESQEKKLEKQAAQAQFKEVLYGHDALGD